MCPTAVIASSTLVTNKQTNLCVGETAIVSGFEKRRKKKKPALGDFFILKGGPSATEVGLGAFLCCLSCSYLADRSYQPSGLVFQC